MDHHHHHHREPLGQQSYSANLSERICLYMLNFCKKHIWSLSFYASKQILVTSNFGAL